MIDRVFKEMPERMAQRPRDARGFPIPCFVYIDEAGVPDFRVIKPGWISTCVNGDRCWLCGGQLGRFKAFVLGPMCALNRVNSEPPCHYNCAKFAALNCPFLSQPLAKRNERNMVEDHRPAAGLPIDRNPGCCAVWVTGSYKPFKAHTGGVGVLFRVGPPERLEFYARGRLATRAEVEASVDTGLPFLVETAREHDGPEGLKELVSMERQFRKLLDTIYPEEAAA